jgi:hypothetical protein
LSDKPKRTAVQVAAGAILRRIKHHGPQTLPRLCSDLPWGETTMRNAVASMVADGLVVKLAPGKRVGPRGLNPHRYGIGPISGPT